MRALTLLAFCGVLGAQTYPGVIGVLSGGTATCTVSGNHWYIDLSAGDDGNSGTSSGSPVQHVVALKSKSGYCGLDPASIKTGATYYDAPLFVADLQARYLAAPVAGSEGDLLATWTDSVGGYDATQSDDSIKCHLTIEGGTRSVSCGGSDPSIFRINSGQFVLPSGLSLNTSRVSMFSVNRMGIRDNYTQFIQLSGSDALWKWTVQGTRFALDADGSGSVINPNLLSTPLGISTGWSVNWSGGGSAYVTSGGVNGEVSDSIGGGTPGTSAGGYIGWSSPAAPSAASFLEIDIYGRTLNATEIKAVRAALDSAYGLPSNPTNLVFWQGDSLTSAFGTVDGRNNPNVAMESLSHTVGFNSAQSGSQVSTYTNAVAVQNYQDALNTPGTFTHKVFVLIGGGNDILHGATASQLYGYMTAVIAEARSLGYEKVVLATMPYLAMYGDPGSAYDLIRTNTNTLIVANAAGADSIVRLDLDARINYPLDPAYRWIDGTHYNDDGEAVIASYILTALQALGVN